MKALRSSSFPSTFHWLMLLAAFLVPHLAVAQAQWQAKVGSQFPDCSAGAAGDTKLAAGCQARQIMGFVPNEIWIHQGDSITWTHATDEGHTVTFLYEPPPATSGVGPYPAAQQRVSGAVGPERDNPRLLRTWLNHFDKQFIGLVGAEGAIQEAQIASNMPVAKSAPSYDHSAFILAYTKDNLAHMIYPSGITQRDWIHDLPQLVKKDWGNR